MFGIFLFVTYYLGLTLKYSPIQTGLAFLRMIGMLVLAAQARHELPRAAASARRCSYRSACRSASSR